MTTTRRLTALATAVLLASSISPVAADPTPSTERVSVRNGGKEVRKLSDIGTASISADGTFVVFGSPANHLVNQDTNHVYDIFVRNTRLGTTRRMSIATDGTEANNVSYSPAISANGRYVTFVSRATNLVPDDTNHADDIFVHDRVTGTTEIVSRSPTTGRPASGGQL